MDTETRFGKEAKGNSEMAYLVYSLKQPLFKQIHYLAGRPNIFNSLLAYRPCLCIYMRFGNFSCLKGCTRTNGKIWSISITLNIEKLPATKKEIFVRNCAYITKQETQQSLIFMVVRFLVVASWRMSPPQFCQVVPKFVKSLNFTLSFLSQPLYQADGGVYRQD